MIVVITSDNSYTDYYYKKPCDYSYRNAFNVPDVGLVLVDKLTPPCSLAVIIRRCKDAGMHVKFIKGEFKNEISRT